MGQKPLGYLILTRPFHTKTREDISVAEGIDEEGVEISRCPFRVSRCTLWLLMGAASGGDGICYAGSGASKDHTDRTQPDLMVHVHLHRSGFSSLGNMAVQLSTVCR